MKRKILINGMSCGHCTAHVKGALEEIVGVTVNDVNLEGKYALVDTEVMDKLLVDAIEDGGYEVVGIENL